MNKDTLRSIIYIIVAILLSVLAVQVFIWLLPIILIVLLASFIYSKMKDVNPRFEKSKSKSTTKTRKNKKIIIDEENND